jgi:hypothetical protein
MIEMEIHSRIVTNYAHKTRIRPSLDNVDADMKIWIQMVIHIQIALMLVRWMPIKHCILETVGVASVSWIQTMMEHRTAWICAVPTQTKHVLEFVQAHSG